MKKQFYCLIGCLFLLIGGCSFSERPYQKDFFAMDTYMSITVYGKNAEQAAKACISEIHELDALLDKNDPNSDIFRLNHAQGSPVSVDARTYELLTEAVEYAALTEGTFDPTINAISELWGIHNGQGHVPSDEELSQAIQKTGYKKISFPQGSVCLSDGATIDLGGIAKGYAADRAARILQDAGISRAVLSLGGNVYVLGDKGNGQPWKVGIQDPDNRLETAATLLLKNCSAVTSGDYERYFEQDGVRYHHIFNPQTGYPGNTGLRSVTVLCESSAKADAYSTALFLMGISRGMEFYREHGGFEAVFILADGSIQYTDEAARFLSSAQ